MKYNKSEIIDMKLDLWLILLCNFSKNAKNKNDITTTNKHFRLYHFVLHIAIYQIILQFIN